MKTYFTYNNIEIASYEHILLMRQGDIVKVDGVVYNVFYSIFDVDDDKIEVVLQKP